MSAADSAAASSDGLITLAILAMGGEGGGVLADWLVDLARFVSWRRQRVDALSRVRP